jgi:hypothetical protein
VRFVALSCSVPSSVKYGLRSEMTRSHAHVPRCMSIVPVCSLWLRRQRAFTSSSWPTVACPEPQAYRTLRTNAAMSVIGPSGQGAPRAWLSVLLTLSSVQSFNESSSARTPDGVLRPTAHRLQQDWRLRHALAHGVLESSRNGHTPTRLRQPLAGISTQ